MAGVARIPRHRGGLCGFLLILLGAWGGLIPFVGPYFHYAFSPDRAWAYTSGRLYLSVLPAIATAGGGLTVLLTRSRALGVLGGLLAAAGGAWFIIGYPIIVEITKKITITPGVPVGGPAGAAIAPGTIGVPAIRVFAEELGFFSGLGIVVVFIAAIAIGRFSMLAAKDVAVEALGADSFPAGPSASRQYPAAQRYPAAQQYPAAQRYPAAQQYPAAQAYAPAGQDAPTSTQELPAVQEEAYGGQVPWPAQTAQPATAPLAPADPQTAPAATARLPAAPQEGAAGDQDPLPARTSQNPPPQQQSPPST